MALGRGHRLAATGRVQHLHRGQDGDGRAVNARQGLAAAFGQILFRPEHAIGTFAITDAPEAALEGAQFVGRVGVVVDGVIDGERRSFAGGHGVGFRGCT